MAAGRATGGLRAMPYFEMHGALTRAGSTQLGVHVWADLCDGPRTTRSEASVIVMEGANFVTAVSVPKWFSPRSVVDVDGDGVAEIVAVIEPPGATPLFGGGRIGIGSLRDGRFSLLFEGQYPDKSECPRTGATVNAIVVSIRTQEKKLAAHEAEYRTKCVKGNLLARSNWTVVRERDQPLDLTSRGKP
jgi:hypothetical protein